MHHQLSTKFSEMRTYSLFVVGKYNFILEEMKFFHILFEKFAVLLPFTASISLVGEKKSKVIAEESSVPSFEWLEGIVIFSQKLYHNL